MEKLKGLLKIYAYCKNVKKVKPHLQFTLYETRDNSNRSKKEGVDEHIEMETMKSYT